MSFNNFGYPNPYYGCYDPYCLPYYCPPRNCEPIIPQCTTAYFESTVPISTNIPSGAVGVAATPIPPFSTSIPPGTVTPITGYSGGTTINEGAFNVNTVSGQITVPFRGNYLITGYSGITASAVGDRQLYIYKQDGSNAQISLLSEISQNAVATGSTLFSISTKAILNKGDSIFFAATQNSGTTLATTTDGRVTISKLN